MLRTFLAAGLLLGTTSLTAADDLKVMIFNIWYGGVQVDFTEVIATVRDSGADIIALQEPEANLRAIAEAAGYGFVNERLHLIAKRPIFMAREGNLDFGYVAVDPEHVVAVAGLHLLSSPYGPELIRDGATMEAVFANEAETRLPEIAPYAEHMAAVAARGVPTFVMGDFNTPSHQDWTATAAAAGAIPVAVEWPVTKLMADAGFIDSYRTIHPDPLSHRGATWTPGTPTPHVRAVETIARIDMIWSAGPATPVASQLLGEAGGPDVDIGRAVWGGDHRAVLSTYDIEPTTAPLLVAVDKPVIQQGEILTARYLKPFSDDGRALAITDTAGAVLQSLPILDGSDHRAVRFGTQVLEPGEYLAAIIDAEGRTEVSTPFWIVAPGAVPHIEVSADFQATWSNGPANRLDWVGVYAAAETDLYNYYGFIYTGARSSGSLSLDPAELGLGPGSYEARLMLDDGYSILAVTPFEVPAE